LPLPSCEPDAPNDKRPWLEQREAFANFGPADLALPDL
jgi:hypothetical protein